MLFDPPLIPARLIRRYKRFLADVTLEDGREVTAHCANPGAMLGVSPPDAKVWLQPNDNPNRKLKFSWQLLEVDGGMVGIDTSLPNKLVAEALADDRIPELSGYNTIRPEVRYSDNSRIDFLMTSPTKPDCYVEVKNVHFRRTGSLAEFPDCVTKRGAKHLHDLSAMVAAGHRAVMLYVVQRDDCTSFTLADDYDPSYAAAYRAAYSTGVETLCYGTNISTLGIDVADRLPVEISG